MDMSSILNKVWELVTIYGIKVLAAIAIFILGRWVAKALSNLIRRMMRKGALDQTFVDSWPTWSISF